MNTSDTQNATRAREYDAADPLARFRTYFHIPAGTIYLDGNSLGAMPLAVTGRLAKTANHEWAEGLIRSWNSASWIQLPLLVGDRIAPLIGVARGEVAVGDSTSVNLFKCLAAAVHLRPDRRVILLEQDNFPTDNYMAEGLAALVGNLEIRVFDSTKPIEPHLASGDVAVVMLSHVHYRTARVQDMSAVTTAIHAAGAPVIWDLSHSVGAVKVELAQSDADFAVGCTYKYLNGGPGAPAFVWVAPRLAADTKQPLSGWMGHKDPFAFTPLYEPGPAVKRFVCGTPQVLSLTALDECLKLWSEVDLDQLFEKSRRLTSFFVELVESECQGHGLVLQSPRNVAERGSHVSFGLEQIGYPVMRALIDRGVIGDFRTPNTIRFGFTPLYVGFSDVERAVQLLRQVLEERLWDLDAYKIRAAVT
jgi:kynureninase